MDFIMTQIHIYLSRTPCFCTIGKVSSVDHDHTTEGPEFCFVLGKDTSTFCTCCSTWNGWGLFEYTSISYCPSNMFQAWQIPPSGGFPKQKWELCRRHPLTEEPCRQKKFYKNTKYLCSKFV